MRRRILLITVCVLTTTVAPRAADPLDPTARLAALAEVWGLLKYFHPGVGQGSIDWDAALVTEIPRVESAASKAEFNAELMRFIASAGAPPAVQPAAALDRPESDPHFAWIEDAELFDPKTSESLTVIRNALPLPSNRFVHQTAPRNENPDFSSERPYNTPLYPSREMRLLALFRYWNMVEYYYPDRDVIDADWRDVLVEMIPRFIVAADALAYDLAVARLTAAITDTHASLVSAPSLTAYVGVNTPGLRTRFIESQTVVTQVFDRFAFGADIRTGDVITDIDGVDASQKRQALRPFLSASNEPALQRLIDAHVLRTNARSISLGVLRFGVRKTVVMSAFDYWTVYSEGVAQDSLQAKWKLLDGNIGYVNMGRLLQSDVAAMYADLRSTRAIVFDVRNYPNDTMYLIAQRLNPEARRFVRFTYPDYGHPGTFLFAGDDYTAGPAAPINDYYRGKVLLLADERTQSHAEFTLMALKTAPDVTLVGSQTAGADGNVSLITLPGTVQTYFSGLGVYFPDGTNTQRVGIVPDVEIHPTIDGIRDGVDEVLQRALALVR